MYITLTQSDKLHSLIKKTEVVLRSYISEKLILSYDCEESFKASLVKIKVPEEVIFSRKLNSKIKSFSANYKNIYETIKNCNDSHENGSFNNEVPFVSELIDLMMIFFNSHFSGDDVIKRFTLVENFIYSCEVYHQVRNNLSHPASYATLITDANKVILFIENITLGLDDKYFWYSSKGDILTSIKEYKGLLYKDDKFKHNLNSAKVSHKALICRDDEMKKLSLSILGNEQSMRLAGSVVLYGYGGVGKTALTIEFLQRLVRDKRDDRNSSIEFILFYSSKDEYLRSNYTTGELYIDESRPEFKTFNELIQLICNDLRVDDIKCLNTGRAGGVIAIDNIENLVQDEKVKIIDFIKTLPRNIQFIITSRSEEACEEKINIQEFKGNEYGKDFITKIIENEMFDIELNDEQTMKLLEASKGNSLIIIQVLNSLHRRVADFNTVIGSLESLKSKDAEMIANFMYKNTFDNAFSYLESNKYPVKDVVRIISLYDEKIELYSLSKLAKIDVSKSERLCNLLCERLILNKVGEYYELNEFAKRFVFIKLLPEKVELASIRDSIKTHKEKMKSTLADMDLTLKSNRKLHDNVNEWQPKNYIDKIVIAETFELYGKAISHVKNKDKSAYEKVLKEMQEHSLITNHPYVPVQLARIIKDAYNTFYQGNVEKLDVIENSYESAIDAIEYDYRYLLSSSAYFSLLMLFGIFLCEHRKDYARSIRFLEDAKDGFTSTSIKPWFICSNYLSKSYDKLFLETKNSAYKKQLVILYSGTVALKNKARSYNFDINQYIRKYSKYNT